MTDRNTLSVGTMLRQYRIEKVIGQGGFGITYLAFDTDLQRQVAIKECFPRDFVSREGTTVVPTGASNQKDYKWAMQKFVDEATTLARFKHPGIVQVLQIIKDENDSAYMVLEFIKGKALDDYLKALSNPLSERALRSLIRPIFDALEVVHEQGIAHRDIAPDNIYIRDTGEAVLLDFGAAKQIFGQHSRTMNLIVKDGYSAPEQYYAEGRQGSWTDIYAFAATLYRTMAGKRPIDAMARLDAINNGEVDPLPKLSSVASGIYSAEFIKAVENGLSPQTKLRPQTLQEWRPKLLGVEEEDLLESDNRLDKAVQKEGPKSKRGLAIAACLAVIAGAAGFGVLKYQENQKIEQELAAVEDAKLLDTLSGYQELIENYPDSEHIGTIRNLMGALNSPWVRRMPLMQSEGKIDWRSGVPIASASNSETIFLAGKFLQAEGQPEKSVITALSNSGRTRWSADFPQKTGQFVTDLKVLDTGEIFTVGYIEGQHNTKAFVAKLNRQGKPIWEKEVATNGDTQFHSLAVTPSGDMFVVGSGISKVGQESDGLFVHVSSDGEEKKKLFLGTEGADAFTGIDVTPNGELVISGYKQRTGGQDRNFWIVKLTLEGTVTLDASPGGLRDDAFYDVVSLRSGEALAVGDTLSFGTNTIDGFIMRVERGKRFPPKIIGDPADDILTAAATRPNRNVLVVGATSSKGAKGLNAWITEYSPDLGSVIWERVVGGDGAQVFHDIEILDDGSVIAVGETEQSSGSVRELLVVRFGKDGQFIDKFNGL